MWTKEEKNKLIEVYSDMINVEIANLLGKSKSSINAMGMRLGLKKSPELIKKISRMGNLRRITNGGRNLTFEVLKEIASKYKTRIDFIRGDEPAYQSARLKGYLDDICQHMTVMKFSIPQLILREITDTILDTKSSYNNRKVIKPYEIDVYYETFNLGFEYQGVVWHNEKYNNGRDLIKRNLIKSQGINIIYIHEYNGSRDYESDIKKQLIDNLKLINSITNKKITKEQILDCKIKNVYLELYNKEDLLKIARKYELFNEFKNKEKNIYRKLCKMKLIDDATKHMNDKKNGGYNFNDVYLKDVISKYNNLTEFRENELILYQHIKRTKKDSLISHLIRKPTYSKDEIEKTIKESKSKSEFIKCNPKMYKFVRRGKLKYLLEKFKNN